MTAGCIVDMNAESALISDSLVYELEPSTALIVEMSLAQSRDRLW